MLSPHISVILPCYNHECFVGEAVTSILGQSFQDLELIVVDDHSRDDSVEVLRAIVRNDSRLKLIVHDQNRGAARSRNDGLRVAQGEIVGFCDADDLWKPDKLERQVHLLRQHLDCDVTYCDSEIIDESGLPTGELFSQQFPLPPLPSGELFELFCTRNFINMTTVLARREALGTRLLFDESIKWVEDWWQWIRLSRHHRFVYEPAALASYRVHPASTGRTQKPGISRNRWKVCRRNLQTHQNMSPQLRSLVWYQMGLELCSMGKRARGCRFLLQAIRFSWLGGIKPLRLARMSARLVVQWIRCVSVPQTMRVRCR